MGTLTEYFIVLELRNGARLFKREQQAGGHTWTLEGARAVPASLDTMCFTMEHYGTIEPIQGSRGEYRLWDARRAS